MADTAAIEDGRPQSDDHEHQRANEFRDVVVHAPHLARSFSSQAGSDLRRSGTAGIARTGARACATATAMQEHEREGALDLRHIGRFYDKDMAVEKPGMEMSKPGTPDLRRRKHSVNVPEAQEGGPADNPPQVQR